MFNSRTSLCRTSKLGFLPSFSRDCKKGKIDRVITKSISRFARNTDELLTVVRTLKEFGVSIYFEEQGIDTKTVDLEMIITFPGMAAQKENRRLIPNRQKPFG